MAAIVLCASSAACSGTSTEGSAVGTPKRVVATTRAPATAGVARQGSLGPVSGAWRLTTPASSIDRWRSQIEGYADPADVLPGQTVRVMVSTTSSWFELAAFRIGGYAAGVARLVWRSGHLAGRPQSAPVVLPTTNTVVAHWSPSVVLHTEQWTPGFYLLKLTSASGFQSYVPLVVRSPTASGRVVLAAPLMDWQAYNDWGGYDLYTAPPGQQRSYAVSFDRPYPQGPDAGARLFLEDAVQVTALAERLRLPLAYVSDVDVSADPGMLDGARAYVTLGHDEYWTVPERRAVTAARDRGMNIAFLSSNTMYWRVRLQAMRSGPDRLVVAYKSDASVADPLRRSHPALTTGRWRDPPDADPENSLTGTLYECYPVEAPYRVVSPRWWGFEGTGVRAGTQFPLLIGDEADRVYPVASTPRPLQILSDTSYDCDGAPTSSQSTYYTTPSGAGVIDFGTQRWACAVGPRCHSLPVRDDAFVRKVTANVLRAFAQGPVGKRFPADDNVAAFALPRINQVPSS
jgi:hypothetical protein